MRTFEVKPGFVAMTPEQFDQFLKIIEPRNKPTEERTHEQLDAAFTAGAPINGVGGKFGIANPRTIMDWAADVKNEAVLTYMLDRAPHLTYTPDGLLGYCLWSPRVTEKLFSLGKSVAKARAAWSRFDAKVISEAHPQVIGMLAHQGYDLNATFVSDGFTHNPFVIQLARHPERLSAALRAGASPGVRGPKERSFLHIAVDAGERSSHAELDQDETAGVKTMRLAKFGDILRTCIELGVDINMVDDEGLTPLHLAARRGYANKARLLLEAGADPTLVDSKGRTAAKLAKIGKNTEAQAVFAAYRAHDTILETLGRAGILAGAKPQ